jgi:hypothetical protein
MYRYRYIQDPEPDPQSFWKRNPDPHYPKKLDPDPHKVNADPKHWLRGAYLLGCHVTAGWWGVTGVRPPAGQSWRPPTFCSSEHTRTHLLNFSSNVNYCKWEQQRTGSRGGLQPFKMFDSTRIYSTAGHPIYNPLPKHQNVFIKSSPKYMGEEGA